MKPPSELTEHCGEPVRFGASDHSSAEQARTDGPKSHATTRSRCGEVDAGIVEAVDVPPARVDLFHVEEDGHVAA